MYEQNHSCYDNIFVDQALVPFKFLIEFASNHSRLVFLLEHITGYPNAVIVSA